eukprot:g957.t1
MKKRKIDEESTLAVVVVKKNLQAKAEEEDLGKIVQVKELCEERRKIYAEEIPALAPDAGKAYACLCEVDEETSEYIFVVDEDNEVNVAMGECSILWDDIPPYEMVEYTFEDDVWRLAKVSTAALTSIMKTKFKGWLKMIKSPSCEAAFKRMLNTGIVCCVYDKLVFPTPDALEEKYSVENEKGVTVHMPHPVKGLRVWNPTTDTYEEVSPLLEGAPKGEDEKKAFWLDLLESLKEEHGAEYIEKLLAPAEDAASAGASKSKGE